MTAPTWTRYLPDWGFSPVQLVGNSSHLVWVQTTAKLRVGRDWSMQVVDFTLFLTDRCSRAPAESSMPRIVTAPLPPEMIERSFGTP
jgi:hypothetical protein